MTSYGKKMGKGKVIHKPVLGSVNTNDSTSGPKANDTTKKQKKRETKKKK